MDAETHYKEFMRVIEKYNLSDADKADRIAHFLTNNQRETISVNDFAKIFALDEDDALIFLSYIEKGIILKRKYIDNHNLMKDKSNT